jgi:RNA polymerase sigma-70 factor (ECF subfamily)
VRYSGGTPSIDVTERGREVVQRMLHADETAFDEFFEDNFPRLYRFALARMHHDHDAAEEVVQATICAAITKLRTYRGEAPLFTWLCTFCRHEIGAHYERLRREPPLSDLVERHADVTDALESLWVSSSAGPEDLFHQHEVVQLVHVALDRLPRRYAEALEWKYVESLSVKEIAARLSLTPKAAESLLTRARMAFREGFSSLMPEAWNRASAT